MARAVSRNEAVASSAVSSPSPRSYGERVGVRGSIDRLGFAESPPHPALRADLSPQAGRGKKRTLRRLRKRSFGLCKRPVDPLRQQRDVLGFHRGAAPDAQARRRIAIMREIVTGAFLLHQGDELLGEIRLRIRSQRGCLLYTSPSPRDGLLSRMPSSA